MIGEILRRSLHVLVRLGDLSSRISEHCLIKG